MIFNIYYKIIFTIFITIFITSCTNTLKYETKIVNVEKQHQEQIVTKYKLKRKIAISRFSNEAQYGKSALFGINTNYNAQLQATDILSAKLAQSEKFVLLERHDIDKLQTENILNNRELKSIDADYIIVGSVTEFGRKNISEIGLLSRVKTQIAYAKVSIRVIDVKTSQIIYAQEGSGESKSEASKLNSFGNEVSYDSTLNDKAINGAINAVVDGMINKMTDTPWKSYILSIEDNNIIIAGANTQGVKVGDKFGIYKNGKKIKNPQTGLDIELPSTKVATIVVNSQFGNSYTNEGSLCSILDGDISKYDIKDLYVQE